jgi:DNA processing protein
LYRALAAIFFVFFMKTCPDDTYHWMALYLVPGLGNIAFKNLLAHFGKPEAVFKARLSELAEVEGIRKETARRIVKREFTSDPEEELRKAEKCNARIMTYAHPSYPGILKEIYDPPMLLYIKGKEIPASKTFIAVVGSRNASHYGLRAAENIGEGLATCGVGVVSGLARGIDSASHRGCLRGKGFTIAVMGTGIDVVYPRPNRKLFNQVMGSGAVISEFPLGSPPEPRNFPIRNRIISGLSRGVVVIEATKKSGSLITASLALDQGREVFAVPGSIESFKSTGTHSLIKQGARLVENSDDILGELWLKQMSFQASGFPKKGSKALPDMDESERKIYEIIEDYPVHIDEIVRLGDLNAGEVLGILMRMELKGLVRQLPGKMFIR